MGDRFNLYFSDAEHELFAYLKTIDNASDYLKSCIKTHQGAKEFGKLNQIMPDEEPYQQSVIIESFKRTYGDILEIGESDFMHVCGVGIRDAMAGRRKILQNVCKNDTILEEKVLDYAREKMPKLGQYL